MQRFALMDSMCVRLTNFQVGKWIFQHQVDMRLGLKMFLQLDHESTVLIDFHNWMGMG